MGKTFDPKESLKNNKIVLYLTLLSTNDDDLTPNELDIFHLLSKDPDIIQYKKNEERTIFQKQ